MSVPYHQWEGYPYEEDEDDCIEVQIFYVQETFHIKKDDSIRIYTTMELDIPS